jgi:DNA-binding response OmpR family regulator
MRVLIIEDNKSIAKAIRHDLKSYYAIDIANTGKEGLRYAQFTQYDTIVLDLNLPDIDGEDICRILRKQGIDIPVIVISGKDQVKDKINLLDMGADDYLTKPFNIHELRARINVAMRHPPNIISAGILSVGDITLDPAARIVTRRGLLIVLRRKEFDLLEYFMRNPGQILTRTMILEHIWDMNENLWANVVDVHIKHLRDKIDRPFGSSLIKTAHGVGYKFEYILQSKNS